MRLAGGTRGHAARLARAWLAGACVACVVAPAWAEDDAAARRSPRVDAAPETEGTDREEAAAQLYAAGALDRIVLPFHSQVIPTTGAGHKIGEWTAWGFLTELVTHEDNVFLTESNRESATIFDTTAGVRMQRVGADFAADVSAALTHSWSPDNSKLNQPVYFLRGGVQWGGEKGWVRVTDILSRKEDSQQFSETGGAGPVVVATRRVKQLLNAFTAAAGYEWGKTGAELRVGHTLTNYGHRLDGLDSDKYRITAVVGREVTPKTGVNMQVEYRETDFDQSTNNDSDALSCFAGAEWAASPKLRVSGRAGYTSQDVDRNGMVTDGNEFSSVTGNLRMDWAATEKTTVNFYVARDYHESLGSNSQTTHIVSASARTTIDPLWSADGSLSYQRSQPSAAADSDRVSARVRVAYQLNERTQVALTYQYQRRNSDAPNGDYDAHSYGLQLTLVF